MYLEVGINNHCCVSTIMSRKEFTNALALFTIVNTFNYLKFMYKVPIFTDTIKCMLTIFAFL